VFFCSITLQVRWRKVVPQTARGVRNIVRGRETDNSGVVLQVSLTASCFTDTAIIIIIIITQRRHFIIPNSYECCSVLEVDMCLWTPHSERALPSTVSSPHLARPRFPRSRYITHGENNNMIIIHRTYLLGVS